ncbi:hypothetical protein LXL04_003021 [Taraxacum kok-saghyz]
MGSISEQNQQTSVLLVTIRAQGLTNPMLRLGDLLASKGLHVTLTTNDLAVKNRPSTIGGVHLEYFSDGLPQDHNRVTGSVDLYLNSLRKFGPRNLSAAADVAAEFGVPCAMVWTQPCAVYQIYNCFYNRLCEFPTENKTDMSEAFHNMHKVKWVLGNTFMELEKDVITSVNDAGDRFWPMGPIVPTTLFGKEEIINGDLEGITPFTSTNESNCLEWLDKHKPASVVYISFGSVLFSSQKQIESIATGLKVSKRPFLWVLKLPVNTETQQQFGILEEIKEQGLIVKWSPQTAVLSHPSIGCFLSHCGWNSLIESITAGVPVIACPRWSDQPTNAKLVTDVWGIGISVKKNLEELMAGEEVGRCVEEIMSGPRSEEFRKKATELKRAAREAMADGGSSDKNIQLFVNVISSFS